MKRLVALLLVLLTGVSYAEYQVKDGAGATKWFNTCSGTGVSGDGFGSCTTETNSASILTSTQLLDDAIATIGSAITAKGNAIAGTDGTNARILKTDTNGELQVDILSGTVIVTQSTAANLNATEVNSSSIKTAVELLDDTVGTDGSATPTKGLVIAGQDGTNAQTIKTDTTGTVQVDIESGTITTMVGTFAEDATHSSGNQGYHMLGVRRDTDDSPVSADGDYHSIIYDAFGNAKTVIKNASTAPVPVRIGDGTNQTSIFTTWADAQSQSVNNMRMGAQIFGYNGSTSDRIRSGGTTATSTFTGYLNNLSFGIYNSTAPALTNGQAILTQVDPKGSVYVNTGSRTQAQGSAVIADTTETTILAAGGASVYHDLVWLLISNESDTNVSVDIRDDTAATVEMEDIHVPAHATVTLDLPEFGWSADADNDNWTAQLSATPTGGGGSVSFTVLARVR